MKQRAPKSALREAVVVKLGGSLGESGTLKRWLGLLVRARRPVIVVPGGGHFADAVRLCQHELRFADAPAHRMAILAMHQTGLMLIALAPRLVAAETTSELRSALAAGRIPVWMPLRMCDTDHEIPQDWSITSDGLAARLAERIRARAVCLVKSRCCEASISAGALSRAGIVDPQFAAITARANLAWTVLGPGEERKFAAALGIARARSAAPATARRRDGGRRRPGAVLSRDHHGTS